MPSHQHPGTSFTLLPVRQFLLEFYCSPVASPGEPAARAFQNRCIHDERRQFMKSCPTAKSRELFVKTTGRPMLIALMLGLSTIQHADAAGPLRVWDSSTPFGDTIDISKTAGWKIVPADLLTLEKDPAKASSDPGYYGRTYEFKGDAVVESETTVAVFWSAKGRVEFYARRAGGGKATLAAKRVFAFAPKELTSPGATITHCEIVRNAGDDIQVEAFFSSEGAKEIPAAFTFDKAGIITVRPDAGMKGVRLTALLEYGVAAGEQLDGHTI